MSDVNKGRIRPEFWASCGRCGQEWVIVDSVPGRGGPPETRGDVERVLRGKGWIKTDLWGWCCPNHNDDGK